MSQVNRFQIRNVLPQPLILNIEPEGVFVPLPKGEEVSVTDEFKSDPVTLSLSNTEKGELVLSIWPGDGDVRVEKCGVNLLGSN